MTAATYNMPGLFLFAGTGSRSVALALLLAAYPAFAAEDGDEGVLGTIAGWLDAWSGNAAEPDVTPSHVFRAVEDLTAEIEILREEFDVYVYPPPAEPQEDRLPVHLYAKTLEIHAKVNAVQARYGVPDPSAAEPIPFRRIVPADVLANVERVTNGLRRIKTRMMIDRAIEPAEFEDGRTPSLVYQSLADASLLLDGLRGRPLIPDDIFRIASHVLGEMEPVARKLGVTLDLETPSADGGKTPTQVAQQVLRATYKIIEVQNGLGMDASRVPRMTLDRVTPADVYDGTNMLLAEMARIRLHLDIDVPPGDVPEPKGKRLRDVFELVLLIVRNLDRMATAAG